MDNNNVVGGLSSGIAILNVPEAIQEHLKKIRESELFMAIVTDAYLKLDVQVAMEFGTALMSGRKIGLLIKKGVEVPERMMLIADAFEFFEDGKDIPAKGDILFNRLAATI